MDRSIKNQIFPKIYLKLTIYLLEKITRNRFKFNQKFQTKNNFFFELDKIILLSFFKLISYLNF